MGTWVSTIMNNATMNICTHFSVHLCFQFSRVYTLEWNCWIIWKLYLTSWMTAKLFFKVVAPFYVPPTMGILISLYPHQYLILFYLSYPSGYEKAMAPHSSTLAWKIPWIEEPGGLQSMGSQRIGYDWATLLSLFAFMQWRRQWHSTPVLSPGKSHGRKSLVGCSPWGR